MERQFKNLAFERSPYVHPRIIGSTVALRRKTLSRCLLLHRAVSNSNRPIADWFQISPTRFQICNRPTIDLLPDLACLLWFEWHSTLDLTLDLWRSKFTNSIGPARSQPSLLMLQLLKTSKDPGLSAAAADCAATDLPSFTIFAIIHPSQSSPSLCCCCHHDCCNRL